MKQHYPLEKRGDKKKYFAKILVTALKTMGSLAGGIISGEPFDFLDLRLRGIDPHKVRQGFYNLQQRRYIIFNKKQSCTFTKKGREWLKNEQLRYFKNQFTKWDKKWRVVIFDIPQDKSLERQSFRRKLILMGFQPLQKSVFIFPYPCEEEIALIARELNITNNIDVILAEYPGFKEENLLKLFDL